MAGLDTLLKLYNKVTYTRAVLCVRNPAKAATSNTEMKADAADIAKKILDLQNSSSTSFDAYAKMQNLANPTGGKYIFIEVQYNPATVFIAASGGKYMEMDRSGSIGAASSSAVVARNRPVTKTCRFQIIIDDIVESRAFGISDNASLTATNVAGVVADLVKSGIGTENSVKSKCEAIMGLVTQNHLQDMVFCYGKMAFHGQLISCTVNYTMFNRDGNPIRATIDMELFQPCDMDMYGNDIAEWKKKYKDAFSTGI